MNCTWLKPYNNKIDECFLLFRKYSWIALCGGIVCGLVVQDTKQFIGRSLYLHNCFVIISHHMQCEKHTHTPLSAMVYHKPTILYVDIEVKQSRTWIWYTTKKSKKKHFYGGRLEKLFFFLFSIRSASQMKREEKWRTEAVVVSWPQQRLTTFPLTFMWSMPTTTSWPLCISPTKRVFRPVFHKEFNRKMPFVVVFIILPEYVCAPSTKHFQRNSFNS